MSENNVNGIIGADVATTTGIVGATIAIGQYIVNDYVITIAEAEGDYGYTMTITRGTDTQTVTLYGLTPEQYNAMLGYLEAAQSAAESAAGSASDAYAYLEVAADAANRANSKASSAEQSSNTARSYATQAQTAKQGAETAKTDAQTARTQAQGYRQAAEAAANRAETAAGQITGMTAEAETLTPGSPATASFLDGVLSLGIPAGANGADGNGIVSIVKTGTSGNVDTYTITYTNGTTSAFTVTNGVDGAVTSVAGKTGAVTLDAGDVAFDDQQAYNDGTVGAGLTNLLSQMGDVNTIVFTEDDLLDTTVPNTNSNADVTNNMDGTYTFGTTSYGSTVWKTISPVPNGTYTLIGAPYGFTFVSKSTSYSGSNLILKNETGTPLSFENTENQYLYVGIRLNVAPSNSFVLAPVLLTEVAKTFIEANQGIENAGKIPQVNETGDVEFVQLIDPDLDTNGKAADAKTTGDKFAEIDARFVKQTITLHHVIPVSGDLDASTYNYMGVIIPNGSNAKITVSCDFEYRGDAIQVQYNDNALFTTINSSSVANRLYNNPVTVDIPNGNTFINNVRIQLNHIASTSGNIDISVVFEAGVEIEAIANILPYNTGKNLINPEFVYAGVNLNTKGWLDRLSSPYAVIGWVPIQAGNYVAFNKKISRGAIVSGLYDGTFNPQSLQQDVDMVENTGASDMYVIFSINANDYGDLIAVSGKYASDYVQYNPIGGYVEQPADRTYGIISMYYPDEGQRAKQIDSQQFANRLRFVHISDTHQSGQNPLRYADQFTDLSGAAFLTLTGDMVNNSIANDFAITAAQINAMEKPCYICMGNHDVWGDTNPTQRYTKYFNQVAEHNDLPENVSYYAVDFASEHVKCIWLDMYELSIDTPSHVMSGTQIAWFFSQLDDAISKSYHVCVFMHEYIGPNDDVIREFNDWDGMNGFNSALKWILDTISAFQGNDTVSFTHNGDSYTHTFNGNGVFVAYFNGHAHWDRTGWIKDYNQFNVTVTRAAVTNEGGTMTGEKLGCAYNYVAVDTSKRKLSIVRIGNERTVFGTDRTAFSIQY